MGKKGNYNLNFDMEHLTAPIKHHQRDHESEVLGLDADTVLMIYALFGGVQALTALLI